MELHWAMQTGRLRGSFRATTLPGITTSRSPSTNPQTGNPPSQFMTLRETGTTLCLESGNDLVGALNSLMSVCSTMHEQLRGFEHRIGRIEQQQSSISEAVKELSTLMKRQIQQSFAVKGSSLEVSAFYGN